MQTYMYECSYHLWWWIFRYSKIFPTRKIYIRSRYNVLNVVDILPAKRDSIFIDKWQIDFLHVVRYKYTQLDRLALIDDNFSPIISMALIFSTFLMYREHLPLYIGYSWLIDATQIP